MADVRAQCIGRDDHAFPEREPVGLDHNRKSKLAAVTLRFVAALEGSRRGGGNSPLSHQFLCENLRGLEARRRFRGSENAQTFGREQIHHSGRERIIRPHHGESDLVLFRELDKRRQIVRRNSNVLGNLRCARVARCAENSFDPGDCRSFQTSACSRPPPPTTRRFIVEWSVSERGLRIPNRTLPKVRYSLFALTAAHHENEML